MMSSLETKESTELAVRLDAVFFKAKVLTGVSGLDILVIENKNKEY